MKKSFLLLAVIAFISIHSSAQTVSTVKTTPISFGLKAGININTMVGSSNNPLSDRSSLVGLNAGVFANFHVSEQFGIQPELAWSTLGAKFEGTLVGMHYKEKQLLNYLTLPVLAKYTLANSGFSLYAGPQIGFLLSAKSKRSDIAYSNKDNYKSTDFAGVAGVEFEFPHTPFNISGRYQFGITEVGEVGSARNNAATFTVGYRLR
ncbi:porin family protein [Filimonas effusa]|uniref:PorT family protein n=1 Tax=Filimonas effusa TaxID=2508721 RepID=A0A4Q1D1R9_9BACT|nr:porin family protein [Filimonas effusa]RXK81240.1 PorT family protein [Filimonas effusa]